MLPESRIFFRNNTEHEIVYTASLSPPFIPYHVQFRQLYDSSRLAEPGPRL